MASPSEMEKQPLLSPNPTTTTPSHNSNEHEDEDTTLAQLQQNVDAAQRAYMRAWSRTTSGKWHRLIILSTTILLLFIMLSGLTLIALTTSSSTPTKVPLEAHIMSKCPDARSCLRTLILPTMQKVSPKVSFRLSFIGKATAEGGVECMHGQSECLGNLIELCAAKLDPDPKIYLGYTMCLSNRYSEIPDRELVEECALEHGIDMGKLNACTVDEDGELSVEMLRASFNRSAEANVTKSCTVRLNDEVRCIRDGGKWTDCEGGYEVEDLVRDIEHLYSNN